MTGTDLPAFDHATTDCVLTALVSGNPTKREQLGNRYGVQHTYSYEDYEDYLNRDDVDAIYIALPNPMHREFTERAARAGVHVLCEKSMAITAEDCEAMIRACDDAGVKLMIADRLHFEEANLQAIEAAQLGQLGELRFYHAVNVQQVAPGNARLDKERGGPLYDLGIYCINAARYLFGDEPEVVVSLSANKGEERFSEIHELIATVFRFPGERLATFTCGFSNPTIGTYWIVGTKGELLLDPAFPYQGGMKYYLTLDGKATEKSFPARDQLRRS